MKKKINKKNIRNYSKKQTKFKRIYFNSGMVYIFLLILIMAGAGAMMLGSLMPITNPTEGQPVITLGPSLETSKNNLQLYYFAGVTYTPTPSPTPTPTPTPTTPPQSSGGGGGSGGGGSHSCFPAGVKILMSNKLSKNIETVKPGDKIIGYNGHEQVEEVVIGVESPVRDHIYKITFSDGTILKLTSEHPVYTRNGWKSISPENTLNENSKLAVTELTKNDQILDFQNNFIEIMSIDYIPGNIQTYNLKSVSGFNNFYADGKLVHNKGGGGGSGGGGGGGSAK